MKEKKKMLALTHDDEKRQQQRITASISLSGSDTRNRCRARRLTCHNIAAKHGF